MLSLLMNGNIRCNFLQLLNECGRALLLNENRFCAGNTTTTHANATRINSHLQARQSSSVTVAILAALERMTLAFDELLLKPSHKINSKDSPKSSSITSCAPLCVEVPESLNNPVEHA